MKAWGARYLPRWLLRIALTMVAGTLWTPAHAAEPAGDNAKEKTLLAGLKAQEDPTILTSRLWAETEWNNDRHDSSSLETTLGARKGWRISDNHDWGVQIELPHKRTSTNVAGTRRIEQGLADIKLTVGTAWRLSDTVRIGGGLELRMPTGEAALSANIWRLQESVTLAWDATPWLTITPRVRYYHTIARQQGARPQDYMELYLPATFLLPDEWSLTPRYEAKIDFENDFVTHAAKLSIGKQLIEPKLNFSLSLKVPFNSPNNDYQVIFNVTRSF